MRALVCAASAAFLLCSMNVSAAPFGAAAPSSSPVTANSAKKPFQESALGNCTAPGTCEIVFPATTAARTLVKHVSCGFILANGGSAIEAYFSGDGNNNANFLPILQYPAAANGSVVNIIDDQTYYFLSSGKKPQIDIITTGAPAASLQCTIVGVSA